MHTQAGHVPGSFMQRWKCTQKWAKGHLRWISIHTHPHMTSSSNPLLNQSGRCSCRMHKCRPWVYLYPSSNMKTHQKWGSEIQDGQVLTWPVQNPFQGPRASRWWNDGGTCNFRPQAYLKTSNKIKNIRNDPQEYPEWPGTHLGGILFLTEPSLRNRE